MDKLAKISKEGLISKTAFLIEDNKFIEKEIPRGKRCDMHCHDKYNVNPDGSIMYTGTPLTKGTSFGIGVREGYSDPEEIYQIAKARGMDFVTISSHNSIKGALELITKYEHEDAFVSCEYDVNGSNAGHVIHVLVSGHEYTGKNPLTVHRKLLKAAMHGHEYFAKACHDFGLFYGLAHPAWISSPKLEMKPEYLQSWFESFSHWEINGDIELENKLARHALDMFLEDGKKKYVFSGSDCHHLLHVGTNFTETLDGKVETPEEFLNALKKGEAGIGSYREGDSFSDRFRGSPQMLLEDTFQGVKHYITRENHLRKKILIYGSLVLLPVGLLIGAGIATIPYVMAFIEKKALQHRTKKLSEDYFGYLESLETKPLEEKIEDIMEEKKEIRQRYKEARDAIQEKNFITNPSKWVQFLLKYLSRFKVFEADYNFELKRKDDDPKKGG